MGFCAPGEGRRVRQASVLGKGLSSPAPPTSSVSPASRIGRTSPDGTLVHSVHILTSCSQPSALILGLDSRGRAWDPVGTPLVLCRSISVTCVVDLAPTACKQPSAGQAGCQVALWVLPPPARHLQAIQSVRQDAERAACFRPVWAHNGGGGEGRGSLPARTEAPRWCVCKLTRSGCSSWHD